MLLSHYQLIYSDATVQSTAVIYFYFFDCHSSSCLIPDSIITTDAGRRISDCSLSGGGYIDADIYSG